MLRISRLISQVIDLSIVLTICPHPEVDHHPLTMMILGLIGFRAQFNYFPDEIYYSATVKEVDDFRAKYPNDFINSDLANDKSQPVATDAPDATAITTSEKPMCEVKEELKQSWEQILKLQEQMQEQNTTLESKVSVLQEQNNVLWKQNASIQGRMEDLHGMLSTLLRAKADSDSS